MASWSPFAWAWAMAYWSAWDITCPPLTVRHPLVGRIVEAYDAYEKH